MIVRGVCAPKFEELKDLFQKYLNDKTEIGANFSIIKNQEILFSPGSTYWGDVWLQFKKHKGALLGAIIFFGIVNIN